MSRLELSIRRRFPGDEAGASPAGDGFCLNVTLQCDAGINILFGASGAGKTLTLDAIAGFYRPEEGRILLDDAILFDAASRVSLPPRRRNVGYVFQNYALFPHMTVEQNLAFGIQHLPPLERGRRIHEQITRFGIADKAARLPRQLSGGEKQRASIARALIGHPKLLLLDEPARGLDHPLRADFYNILRQVRQEHRIPILLVTHDADEAYLLADRVAVFERGAIVQCAPGEEVFQRPVNAGVARLLGIGNIFRGTVEALDPMAGTTRIRVGALTLTLPYLPGHLRGDEVEFCVRREHIRLHEPGAAQRHAGNFLPGLIVEEIHSPTHVRLNLELGGAEKKPAAVTTPPAFIEAEVTRQAFLQAEMKKHRQWIVEIPPDAAHVFSGSNPEQPAAG